MFFKSAVKAAKKWRINSEKTAKKQDVTLQFSFDKFTKKQPTQEPMVAAQPPSSSPSAISADERLRKAIERNRAKLAKKPEQDTPSMGQSFRQAPSAPSSFGQNNSSAGLNRAPSSASNNTSSSETLMERMRAMRENSEQRTSAPIQPASASTATRKIVTDPDKIEMSGTLRKPATVPATVNYSDTAIVARETLHKKLSAKRKLKTKTKFEATSTMSWFVKGSWIFCAFLIARLVFSEGGVVEYYQKRKLYNQKNFDLETTKVENQQLMDELESIRSNGKYQKKLVRDHLGYIARDEYLILFSKNPSQEQLNSEVSAI